MCVACLAGCASTKLTSFVDPDFKDKVYVRIMVFASYEELDTRQEVENIFVEAFRDSRTEAVSSLTIMLPTREYGDAEVHDVLVKNQVDAVLTIRQIRSWEETDYIPERRTTYTRGYLTGHTFHVTKDTHVTGGYYVSEPRSKHSIVLYDAATNRTAWIATTFTKGYSHDRSKRLFAAMAKKVMQALRERRVITPGGS